jgi:beta-glucosidase/6-phospho-beta-glucosidase/beta-galactosidase
MTRIAILLALAVFGVVASSAAAAVVRPFPAGFLWGTAISAFQTEMGRGAPNDPNTDWWAWVRDADNIADSRVSGDLPEDGPGLYTRYAEDARRARRLLNTNALRLSIEWSRIFPASTAAVDASPTIALCSPRSERAASPRC